MYSFSEFHNLDEARRGPAAPGKAEKGEKAKASLDAVKSVRMRWISTRKRLVLN